MIWLFSTFVTCLVRVAEDGLLLMGPRAMSHPHRDGEGLLQAGGHHAIRHLDGLGTVELKDLVAVMSVICGKSYCPVGRAAWCRKKLHCTRTGSWKKRGQRQLYRALWFQLLTVTITCAVTYHTACAVTSQNKCHGRSPSQYGWFPVQYWPGWRWLVHHRSPSACWGKGPGCLCQAHIQSSY